MCFAMAGFPPCLAALGLWAGSVLRSDRLRQSPNGRQIVRFLAAGSRERSCDLATGWRANHLTAGEIPAPGGTEHRCPQMGTVRRSALAAAHPAGGEGSSTNAAARDALVLKALALVLASHVRSRALVLTSRAMAAPRRRCGRCGGSMPEKRFVLRRRGQRALHTTSWYSRRRAGSCARRWRWSTAGSMPSGSPSPRQDLHRSDLQGLRVPGLPLRPRATDGGEGDAREVRRTCHPALRARAGGARRLPPAWEVRATMGAVGQGGAGRAGSAQLSSWHGQRAF